MKQTPILFKTEMVEAILSGRKTQTRRLIKMPKDYNGGLILPNGNLGIKFEYLQGLLDRLACPYGFIGDRLWVKETYISLGDGPGDMHYKASATEADLQWIKQDGIKWKPSIFMPRAASRITLEITDIRAERLQQITEADALAEGVNSVKEYAALWEKINGPGSWDENPWVWVITLKKLEK